MGGEDYPSSIFDIVIVPGRCRLIFSMASMPSAASILAMSSHR
jgi:hypothetical protein